MTAFTIIVFIFHQYLPGADINIFKITYALVIFSEYTLKPIYHSWEIGLGLVRNFVGKFEIADFPVQCFQITSQG